MRQFRYRYHLGDLAGIPLFVDISAIVLLLLVYLNLADAGLNVVLVGTLVLAGGIILHELGHGLAARAQGAFGITITLWALGGVCSAQRDMLPRRELVILVAGPLVSYILALVGYLAWYLLLEHQPGLLGSGDSLSNLGWLILLLWKINLMLGIFNSLPIFPLDGGQILFNVAKLTLRKERLAAKVTMAITVLVAILFLAWSWWNPETERLDRFDPWDLILVAWVLGNAFQYLR